MKKPSKLLKTFAEFAMEFYPSQLEPTKDSGEWVTGDPTPDKAYMWNGSKSSEENLNDMNNQIEKDRE